MIIKERKELDAYDIIFIFLAFAWFWALSHIGGAIIFIAGASILLWFYSNFIFTHKC